MSLSTLNRTSPQDGTVDFIDSYFRLWHRNTKSDTNNKSILENLGWGIDLNLSGL